VLLYVRAIYRFSYSPYCNNRPPPLAGGATHVYVYALVVRWCLFRRYVSVVSVFPLSFFFKGYADSVVFEVVPVVRPVVVTAVDVPLPNLLSSIPSFFRMPNLT